MIPGPQVGPEVYAQRAERAWGALQRHFGTPDGGYRRDGRRPLRAAAHLWPFARALVALLDLAGVRPGLTEHFDADAAIVRSLAALERYWDPSEEPPAYSSDLLGARWGGDLYYDDNAWVGLALIQHERLRPGAGRLDRAAQLFRFAVAGWDGRGDAPRPGGVFWVQQGRGLGAKNHDRNTVSSAPNAELGLHLADLTGAPAGIPGRISARDMYEWVNASLDAGARNADAGSGLFWDKIRGDGTIDETLWSYNQGSMIGANVLLARGAGGERGACGDRGGPYLARAEAIARRALRHYAGRYETQPASFNAIFFRNLLLLHAATGDADLREGILESLRGYVDRAWVQRRDRSDGFRLSGKCRTLLDQSAMVSLLALLAWDPGDYSKLA